MRIGAFDVLRATFSLYASSSSKAVQALFKNPGILAGSVALYLIYIFLGTLLLGMGVSGRFAAGLLQVLLLSLYFGWISEVSRELRLPIREMPHLDYSILSQVVSVAFIFFLAEFPFALTQSSSPVPALMAHLAIVILFNAVPEAIIQHRMEGIQALSHAFRFTIDNWLEWFFPFVILLLPILLVSPTATLIFVAQSEPLLPPFVVITSFGMLESSVGFLATLLAILVANWFMLFRSFLFVGLESGSRRKRIYDATHK